jgi:hypothetical protein
MKQPSALLPIVMSVAALALVLGHVAIFGVVHEADEGAAAHLWQLLMAGQVPVVAYFALKWLLRAPGQALRVLARQAVAALAACAPVYWFKLPRRTDTEMHTQAGRADADRGVAAGFSLGEFLETELNSVTVLPDEPRRLTTHDENGCRRREESTS